MDCRILEARFERVKAELLAACTAAGRDPASVRLIAVSKLQPAESVLAALRLGQHDFGENYAQELRDKRATLSQEATATDPLQDLRWHFIGPLQRNKVNLVAGNACLIHTVDSLPLIEALAARVLRNRATAADAQQDCLIQINVAGEAQKSGCDPSEVPALLDGFARAGGALRCSGFMCLPPLGEDPESSRPHFQKLRELRDTLRKDSRPHVELSELSMGMSHDFAVAIAEGATLVRVGSAIFGARPAPTT